jgi:type III secretion system YscQ/HrcQ family protein
VEAAEDGVAAPGEPQAEDAPVEEAAADAQAEAPLEESPVETPVDATGEDAPAGSVADGVSGDISGESSLDGAVAEAPAEAVAMEAATEASEDAAEEAVEAEEPAEEVALGEEEAAVTEEDPLSPIHEKALEMLKEVKFAASAARKIEGIDVGAVEIELTFDLGTTRLTLKDLEALREGYAFTLDRPNDEFVNIRANGQLLGRGRIVDIDGRVGVQIEEFQL